MRAEYDTEAEALAITIAESPHADSSDPVHDRGRVALQDGLAVDVEIRYPDRGVEAPLEAAAAKYGLDLEALLAAARSALAAPNRTVTVEVAESASV